MRKVTELDKNEKINRLTDPVSKAHQMMMMTSMMTIMIIMTMMTKTMKVMMEMRMRMTSVSPQDAAEKEQRPSLLSETVHNLARDKETGGLWLLDNESGTS